MIAYTIYPNSLRRTQVLLTIATAKVQTVDEVLALAEKLVAIAREARQDALKPVPKAPPWPSGSASAWISQDRGTPT